MRFNPLPDFRNSKAELLYVGERKFSATEFGILRSRAYVSSPQR